MRSGLLGRLLLASTILTLPMTAHAQEAAVSNIIDHKAALRGSRPSFRASTP